MGTVANSIKFTDDNKGDKMFSNILGVSVNFKTFKDNKANDADFARTAQHAFFKNRRSFIQIFLCLYCRSGERTM